MVELAQRKLGDTIRFELHAGGLFPGGPLPDSKRRHILSTDRRIAELTGQQFGTRYLDELLSDPATNYDSAAPVAAILAALELEPDSGLRMLRAIQHAHYRDGLRIADPAVLVGVAESIGLEAEGFAAALASTSGEPTRRHISATHKVMRQVGATGFPTFFLQRSGSTITIEHQHHYRSPEDFVKAVLQATT